MEQRIIIYRPECADYNRGGKLHRSCGKRGELREHRQDRETRRRPLSDSGGEVGESMAGRFRFCYEAGPCGYGNSAPAERSWARMRRSRPVVDIAQARRSGQNRPTRRD